MSFFLSQVIAKYRYGDNHQTPQELQQVNLLQTLQSSQSSFRSRHRHKGVLPLPEPVEDPELFVLDLKNFPELANADMGSQNPNIQVGNVERGRNFLESLYHWKQVQVTVLKALRFISSLKCRFY